VLSTRKILKKNLKKFAGAIYKKKFFKKKKKFNGALYKKKKFKKNFKKKFN